MRFVNGRPLTKIMSACRRRGGAALHGQALRRRMRAHARTGAATRARIRGWVTATRPQFLAITAVAVCLGWAGAWAGGGLLAGYRARHAARGALRPWGCEPRQRPSRSGRRACSAPCPSGGCWARFRCPSRSRRPSRERSRRRSWRRPCTASRWLRACCADARRREPAAGGAKLDLIQVKCLCGARC